MSRRAAADRLDRGDDRVEALAAGAAEAQLATTGTAPLVRLLTRGGAAFLDEDELTAFLAAGFRWVAADEDYCTLYCLPERGEEVEARTRSAAAGKQAARRDLEAELRQCGISAWTNADSAAVRQRVRQILQHARSSSSASEAAPAADPLSGASSQRVHSDDREGTLQRRRRRTASPQTTPPVASPSRPPQSLARASATSTGINTAEVQRLREQVRLLENRMERMEHESERLATHAIRSGDVQTMVDEAVAAALSRRNNAAAGPPSIGQRRVDSNGGPPPPPPSAPKMSDGDRLHWAATRIQAVHRGKVNRSIGNE